MLWPEALWPKGPFSSFIKAKGFLPVDHTQRGCWFLLCFSPSIVNWLGDFHLLQMWLSFLCGWRGKGFISILIIVHPPNAFMCDFECILGEQ